MKFLCLGYGDEAGWNALNEAERKHLLAQDATIRERGNLMAAVQTQVTTISNWGGHPEVMQEPYAQHWLPLAGFSVIEAKDLQEVVELVANTPCARARGFIEIRPLWTLDDADT